MSNHSDAVKIRRGFIGTSLLAALCLTASMARGADYGRVSGSVLDSQGNPLMGATVLIEGPLQAAAYSFQPTIERILTDAHGKFTAGHLMPGWYSLRVISATRIPALHDGVHIEAGQTAQEKFVLSDIFAPLHFQLPPAHLATWGDDWKWVLRTSASTRPVMRFQKAPKALAKTDALPLPASQRLIGMMPGSTRREALESDAGMGSVLAYLRPLSADADMLVAGEMTADGSQTSSLATAFRKHLINGDPEELTLVMHQLNLGDGTPFVNGEGSQAQALSASYSQTRRLSDSVTVTSGIELDYLNAGSGAMTVHPHVKLEYQPNPSNTFAIRFGTGGPESSSSLIERVGDLNAFPRITLRGDHPHLEKMNHAEVSFDRRMGKTSRAQLAVYRDDFENTAVWGIGTPGALAWLAGSVLPNAHVNGVTVNAGNYGSSGVRAVYMRSIGNRIEAAVVYTTGSALVVRHSEFPAGAMQGNLREILSNDRSQSVAGKISARVPMSRTEVTTSYQWIERGRVTGLDPFGQASLQLEPYLGIQIRQPLPTLAFFPAHIEALADFRNLLAQGYVPASQGGDRLILTPAYRSFRGGFSVQF
ncbi:MAG: carboxypeptidase-like regulatory domain-containing protein [Terriglobia bacterium]